MGAVVCRACRFVHDGSCKRLTLSNVKLCAGCADRDATVAALMLERDTLAAEVNALRSNKTSNTVPLESNATFDKKAYQREYMRKKRAGG